MKIVFIVPASDLRRIPLYRLGGKIYGQSNSITGPLILGGILKKAGYQVEAYEERPPAVKTSAKGYGYFLPVTDDLQCSQRL